MVSLVSVVHVWCLGGPWPVVLRFAGFGGLTRCLYLVLAVRGRWFHGRWSRGFVSIGGSCSVFRWSVAGGSWVRWSRWSRSVVRVLCYVVSRPVVSWVSFVRCFMAGVL